MQCERLVTWQRGVAARYAVRLWHAGIWNSSLSPGWPSLSQMRGHAVKGSCGGAGACGQGASRPASPSDHAYEGRGLSTASPGQFEAERDGFRRQKPWVHSFLPVSRLVVNSRCASKGARQMEIRPASRDHARTAVREFLNVPNSLHERAVRCPQLLGWLASLDLRARGESREGLVLPSGCCRLPLWVDAAADNSSQKKRAASFLGRVLGPDTWQTFGGDSKPGRLTVWVRCCRVESHVADRNGPVHP